MQLIRGQYFFFQMLCATYLVAIVLILYLCLSMTLYFLPIRRTSLLFSKGEQFRLTLKTTLELNVSLHNLVRNL